MDDRAALQRLLVWLSPAFPIGGFAYSAGLETAIAAREVATPAELESWISGSLRHGSTHTDAILLAEAHRAAHAPQRLQELADLSLALIPARQRCEETLALGGAFLLAASAWPAPASPCWPDPCPYPIALGARTGAAGLPLDLTLVAFLTSLVHSQISVAVRLVPMGQTDGLMVQAALEPLVASRARAAAAGALAELGAIGYAADIAAMAHETLPTRIFRS